MFGLGGKDCRPILDKIGKNVVEMNRNIVEGEIKVQVGGASVICAPNEHEPIAG